LRSGGAHTSLALGSNVEVALVLGTISGVGGGVLRDLLVNRVPVILEKEIYALAALAGASIQVIGALNGHSTFITPWVAAAVCLAIRSLAVRYSWSLPRTWPPGRAICRVHPQRHVCGKVLSDTDAANRSV
jgi:uncharacterized membrane protein YeiH